MYRYKNTVKVTEYLHIPNTVVKPFHRQAFKTAFALTVKIQIKINSVASGDHVLNTVLPSFMTAPRSFPIY